MNACRLRGEIAAAYKTQARFAKAVNWHVNKASKMITGKYVPTVDEAAEISEALNLSRERYEEIFLTAISPNGEM